MSSFTQRVGYVDGEKHMFQGNTMGDKAFELALLNGEIYSVDLVSKIII